jgi:transaldolase
MAMMVYAAQKIKTKPRSILVIKLSDTPAGINAVKEVGG